MTVAELTRLLGTSSRIVAFTGAGVSTESGIPDFRSPGGLWTRYDPRDFAFDRYVESAEVRTRSWQMRHEFLSAMPEPNRAHRALAELEAAGQLLGVITQNIDGLHQAAGSRNVIEIHGNVRDVVCIGRSPRGGVPEGCGFIDGHEWAIKLIDAGTADPRCPSCGGVVKTATISFGQAMPADAMNAASDLVSDCDLLLTIGSSLEVYPAAALPLEAKQAGARVVIINKEATDLDWTADLVLRGEAGAILSEATHP